MSEQLQINWYNDWLAAFKKGNCTSIAGNKVTKDQLWDAIDWLFDTMPDDICKSETEKQSFANYLNIPFRHLIEKSLMVGERPAYINMLKDILQIWKKYLD